MVDELVWLSRVVASGAARSLREGAGLTASDLARELKVSPSAVSRWERGMRRPQGAVCRRYVRLLRRLAEGGS